MNKYYLLFLVLVSGLTLSDSALAAGPTLEQKVKTTYKTCLKYLELPADKQETVAEKIKSDAESLRRECRLMKKQGLAGSLRAIKRQLAGEAPAPSHRGFDPYGGTGGGFAGPGICSGGVCSGPQGTSVCTHGVCSTPRGTVVCSGGVCNGPDGTTVCGGGACSTPHGTVVCFRGICH